MTAGIGSRSSLWNTLSVALRRLHHTWWQARVVETLRLGGLVATSGAFADSGGCYSGSSASRALNH